MIFNLSEFNSSPHKTRWEKIENLVAPVASVLFALGGAMHFHGVGRAVGIIALLLFVGFAIVAIENAFDPDWGRPLSEEEILEWQKERREDIAFGSKAADTVLFVIMLTVACALIVYTW